MRQAPDQSNSLPALSRVSLLRLLIVNHSLKKCFLKEHLFDGVGAEKILPIPILNSVPISHLLLAFFLNL